MTSIKPWYSRPLFISSTFKDMQAERDYLRDVVFPELERRMNERQCHLETVDLRWGIETVTTPAQEKKELLVLKVCLDEIERCRPFLIVILGDRYGWVPPAQRMKVAIDEKGYSMELANKSVTALEIEYGIFANPYQKNRSLLYFREIENYEDMPFDKQQMYSDYYGSAPESRANYDRLQALKIQIEEDEVLNNKTRHYNVRWENNKLTGLDVWGKQVIEDIWQELEKDTKEYTETTDPSWQGQERKNLEEFVELRSKYFVGRLALLQDLKAIAFSEKGAETLIVSIQGGPGTGKSALFAKLKRELEAEGSDCFVLIHAAGISPRSGNVEDMIRRWIQELEKHLGFTSDLPSKNLDTFEKRKKRFAELLSMASANKRIICLIDALNQLERTFIARHMTWLPELWPQNARLITTAIPGDETKALSKLTGIKRIELPKLDHHEAGEVVQTLCSRYHKTPHPDIVNALTSIKTLDNTQAAGNPLWLSVAVEHLLLMDEDDFIDAGKLSGTPEEKLHLFMLKTSEGFPPDIESLYESLLTRTHERFGKRQGIDWIPDMLEFIATSRNGFRETDIRNLLNRINDESFELQFAAVRRYLRAHLVERNQGAWSFVHSQMNVSIMNRNLTKSKDQKQIHSRIANHLESLSSDDFFRQTELMWHLINSDDKLRMALYYVGDLSTEERSNADAAINSYLIEISAESKDNGRKWVKSLLQQEQLKNNELYILGFRLGEVLNFPDTNRDSAAALWSYSTALKILERYDGDNTLLRLTVADLYSEIWDNAYQLYKQNREREALVILSNAIQITLYPQDSISLIKDMIGCNTKSIDVKVIHPLFLKDHVRNNITPGSIFIPQFLILIGMSLAAALEQNQKKYKETIVEISSSYLEIVATLFSHSSILLTLSGQVNCFLGEFDSAIKLCEKALIIDPGYITAKKTIDLISRRRNNQIKKSDTIKKEHTDWPTAGGNPARYGLSNEPLKVPLKLAWSFDKFDGIICCGIVCSQGIAIFGDSYGKGIENWLIAINIHSGEEIWRNKLPGMMLGTPTITGEHVLVGNGKEIICLDLKTGKKQWHSINGIAVESQNLLSSINCSLKVGDYLFFADNFLFAVNIHNGNTVAEINISHNPNNHTGPCTDGKFVYCPFSRKEIILLNYLTGDIEATLKTKGHVSSGPVVIGNMLLYGTNRSTLQVVNLEKMSHQWEFLFPGEGWFVNSRPAVANGKVYIGGPDNAFYCLRLKDGKILWNVPEIGDISSPAIVFQDKVFQFTSKACFLFSSIKGETLWRYEVGDWNPANCAPAFADGTVLVGWDKIYAFSGV